MPDLERDVMNTVNNAIGKSIEAALAGYQSPMVKLVNDAVARRAAEISDRIDAALANALTSGNLAEALNDVFSHKLARVLLSKMEGAMEKLANDIRSNPAFKARLIVAVESAVKEFGPEAARAVRAAV